MRITSDMNMRMMSSALLRSQQEQHKIYRQMSTGRKVNLASDDPGAYEGIRNLRGDLARLQQYERNANMASHYLSMADQGMERTVAIIHRANELAVTAQDATLDPDTRKAVAEEVDQLLQSLLDTANSSEGGRFTFAGLRTDTKPFEVERDPDTGAITAVLYTGSTESRMVQTGPQIEAVTNLAGGSDAGEGGLFQTATRDLFDSLIALRDDLRESPSSSEASAAVGTQLKDDLDHVLAQASLNGARHEQVKVQTDVLREAQLTAKQSLDSLESVDMAEASMRLSQAETSYQAALYSTATMMRQVSLLNFI